MKFKLIFLIPLFSLALLVSSFIDNNADIDKDGQFVVVLDAGHGGHDPGNLGNGYFEKNIALSIVLKIGKVLEQDPNIKVIYTRKDDTFVDLYVRGEIANKANADLFVSVHCDSHSSNAHGAGTFVLGLHANKQNFEIAKKENSVIYLEDNYENRYAAYDINSPESVIGLTIMQEEFLDQSIALAKVIQDNFSNKLKRNDRQVKQAGFIVLHQTFMPSVLVETGFLTNDEEGAYLNSSRGQSEMGTAIAEAILKYKNGVQPNLVQANDPLVPIGPPDKKAEEVVDTPKADEKRPENSAKDIVMDPVAEVTEAKTEPEKTPAPVREAPKPTETVPQDTPETTETVKKETKKPAPPETLAKKEGTEPPKPAKKETERTPIIVFKVQLLASVKDLDLRSDNFRGLSKLSRERYKNMFRYMYGKTNSFEDAKLLKSNADVKGYTTSFIVAYRDGERISVPEARKYVSD